MDYADGSVIAHGELPDVRQPLVRGRAVERRSSSRSSRRRTRGHPIDPDQSILVNRAVQGRYNLGSTFKPFTAFAALNTGLISAGDYYKDAGAYRMHESVDQDRCDAGPRALRVQERHLRRHADARAGTAAVNVDDALAVSSDAFFYRIGED